MAEERHVLMDGYPTLVRVEASDLVAADGQVTKDRTRKTTGAKNEIQSQAMA